MIIIMAGFSTATFNKHDDYMTPDHAWDDIKQYIPKVKIWEAFYGDGKSGDYLKELGYDVINEERDFYDEPPEYDCIVSNPPFSDTRNIIPRLNELDKPFILIMPSSKINTQYFRDNFMNKGVQLIVPKKRINFIKLLDGQPDRSKKACNFECFYYCYKIGLERDIVWI